MKQFVLFILINFFSVLTLNAQLFPNGDFEAGTGAGCACATDFICNNDAGRVVDGVHPVYMVGNQGCVTGPTNYTNSLGAHSGTGYMYFYAGADNYRTAASYNFVGGEEVCFSVWYCGPQGSGAPGQNTANAHFSFGVDGTQVGPDVPVPVNTPWTEHTFTMIMTPGLHTFYILSGGAAQYSIWTDDFNVDICSSVPCDGSWNNPSPVCDDDPDIDLNTLITGDAGGTWSGTGVTGNFFDPSSGTQSITYTAPCGDAVTQTITVNASGNPAWTIPPSLCSNESNLDLNTWITGTPGGVWSGVGVTGNFFDPSTGTQSITYTVGTTPCDQFLTQIIDVIPSSDPSWNSPGSICESDGIIDLSSLVTGTPGGTWSGTGVTGNSFDPSGLSGSIAITYTVGTSPCIGTSVQDIIVNAAVNAAWTAPLDLCSEDGPIDLSTFITGTTGGTWSGTGISGSIFDPSVGSQTITYSVGTFPCDESMSLLINVDDAPSAAWTTLTVCQFGPDINLNSLITGTPGGTWSGTGVTGNMFDPSVGIQSITYTVTNGTCTSVSTQTINVSNPTLTISGTNISCFGANDGSATVIVSGGSGSYSYSWNTTPVQTTATATGLSAGIYTVNVTDITAGCAISAEIIIAEPDEIILVMDSLNACEPNLGTASVIVSGGVGPYQYVWNNSSSTNNIATDLDSAIHTVTVTDANGCSVSDSVMIIIYPAPAISISPDTTILNGGVAQLWVTGGELYVWSPSENLSCVNCQYPVADPLDTTIYCVQITDTVGCIVDACTKVNVEILCGEVFVPNAFSPDNLGDNDLLCVYSNCIQTLTFQVYDRWGEKVFESSNTQICWDGTFRNKPMNTGVYVYVLEATLINGTKVSKSGNVTLVR